MKTTRTFTRSLALVLALIMLAAMALTGCGSSSNTAAPAATNSAASDSAAPAAPAGEKHRMVLIGSVSGGTFWGPIEENFKATCAELGWDCDYWAPAAPGDAANLELCDTALVQGYDIIAAVMNETVLFEDFLNRAKEAGVTVLGFNCDPGEDWVSAIVGIDAYNSGYQQGEKIAQFAKEKGFADIRYYATCTALSVSSQMETKQGVLDALAANFDGEVIELGMVEVKDNAATGEDGMAQLYINHGDVNTIFCIEATGAVAAGAFIESKGLQDKVIACGLALNDEAFERVMNGSWTATSMVDVAWMGAQVVRVAKAVVEGGEYQYENFPDKIWVCNEEEIAAYKAAHAG